MERTLIVKLFVSIIVDYENIYKFYVLHVTVFLSTQLMYSTMPLQEKAN